MPHRRFKDDAPVSYVALDLCSGAGGVTTGLRKVGVRVLGAVDNDPDCIKTMRANHRKTKVLELDLANCTPSTLRKSFGLKQGQLDILTICTPCQTFSSMAVKHLKPRDSRSALVDRIGDFVSELQPRALIMENVPQLAKHRRFRALLRRLGTLGYSVQHKIVCASEAGVPQRRRRLVCVAIRDAGKLPPLDLKAASKWFRREDTVRKAFVHLNACKPKDPLNQGRRPTGIVAKRMKEIPKDGGSRDSLKGALELNCHKRLRKRGLGGSGNVYGRMQWDALAPTLTTRCTTPACGRFTHPSLLRPITLREAALLQSFPPKYQFRGTNGSIERQVGNAVPPRLAAATAKYVLAVLAQMRTKRRERNGCVK